MYVDITYKQDGLKFLNFFNQIESVMSLNDFTPMTA
jgi:hypothetical protein